MLVFNLTTLYCSKYFESCLIPFSNCVTHTQPFENDLLYQKIWICQLTHKVCCTKFLLQSSNWPTLLVTLLVFNLTTLYCSKYFESCQIPFSNCVTSGSLNFFCISGEIETVLSCTLAYSVAQRRHKLIEISFKFWNVLNSFQMICSRHFRKLW